MRTVDAQSIGRAVRQAGIDPRVWATGGRIVTNGNSVRWDSALGWVIDVEGYGGGFSRDVLRARVATNHPNEFIPLDTDCEVMVIVPEGQAGGIPTIVGTINNADGCEAPPEIQGMLIDGSLPVTVAPFELPIGAISPYDTEIKVSPHNRREAYGGDKFVSANNHILEAALQVRLALRDADQSYVRGEAFTEVLGTLLDDIVSYVEAAGAANLKVYAAINILAPGTVTPAEIALVGAAIQKITLPFPVGSKALYDLAIDTPGDALSFRIKGE